MQTNNQTVFIIDDDMEICAALRWLFESVHLKVETFDNAQSFLDIYDKKKEGCLIIDVRLPGMSGLELLAHLKKQKSHLPVILITAHSDIQMAIRGLKGGAKDFILKPFNEQCLIETVQKQLNQLIDTRSMELVNERMNNLSVRERQIIDLILDGKLNKQMAHELSISISTVEAHRASIMHKIGANNVAQLIKICLQFQFSKEYV